MERYLTFGRVEHVLRRLPLLLIVTNECAVPIRNVRWECDGVHLAQHIIDFLQGFGGILSLTVEVLPDSRDVLPNKMFCGRVLFGR